jgi:hypothetical protein
LKEKMPFAIIGHIYHPIGCVDKNMLVAPTEVDKYKPI